LIWRPPGRAYTSGADNSPHCKLGGKLEPQPCHRIVAFLEAADAPAPTTATKQTTTTAAPHTSEGVRNLRAPGTTAASSALRRFSLNTLHSAASYLNSTDFGRPVSDRSAYSATVHCLTGCAIGEILGLVIATAAGWSTVPSIAIAVVLAFMFGYPFTLGPVLRAGVPMRRALRLAFASDTASIAVMEIVDNAFILIGTG
jgi:hypothetical protein